MEADIPTEGIQYFSETNGARIDKNEELVSEASLTAMLDAFESRQMFGVGMWLDYDASVVGKANVLRIGSKDTAAPCQGDRMMQVLVETDGVGGATLTVSDSVLSCGAPAVVSLNGGEHVAITGKVG